MKRHCYTSIYLIYWVRSNFHPVCVAEIMLNVLPCKSKDTPTTTPKKMFLGYDTRLHLMVGLHFWRYGLS